MGRQIKKPSVRVAGLELLPAEARRPRLLASAVRRTFARQNSRLAGEVNVVFLKRSPMRALNREFLGREHDTDVIAFRHEERPGLPARERPIGDIYISSWMAVRQAAGLGHGVLREAMILAVHGTLHILGHDDSSPRGRARMFRLQDEILAGVRA